MRGRWEVEVFSLCQRSFDLDTVPHKCAGNGLTAAWAILLTMKIYIQFSPKVYITTMTQCHTACMYIMMSYFTIRYLCFLISCKLQKQMIKKMVDKPARASWSYQIHSTLVSKPRVFSVSVPLIHSCGRLQRERRVKESVCLLVLTPC